MALAIDVIISGIKMIFCQKLLERFSTMILNLSEFNLCSKPTSPMTET
jgi:hypothetical protein